MSGRIGRIEPFDNSSETWDAYEERLEQYFICNKVPDVKKVSVLVTLIGGSTYQLLRNLTAPRKPSEETCVSLVTKLREHLCPKPLVIAERFRFNKREQRESETVREYIASLRKLSEHCNFGTHLNDSLRDRLVCGFRNEQIQKKLLSESDLTLDKAIEIAIAMETAARDAVELQTKHNAVDVNKLHVPVKSRKEAKSMKQHKGHKAMDTPHNTSSLRHCFRCHGHGHSPDECYYKDKQYFSCKRTGHARRACPKARTPRRKHIHALDENSDYDSASDNIIANLSVKSLHEVISVPVYFNGKPIKMELDTGAAVSVMPKRKFRENFANVKILPSDVTLKTYSGEELKPVGYVMMTARYEGQTHSLKLNILPKGKSILLGRDWLSKIKLNWHQLGKISVSKKKQVNNSRLQQILDKHTVVFNDDWGILKDIQAKPSLKPDATPKFMKARTVAHALKERVNKELDKTCTG